MNELITQTQNLPANIEDLSKFILIGREKLKLVRAGIQAIDKLQVAEEVIAQKREEAQMLSEALLDAEVRAGELLKLIPKQVGGRPTFKKTTDSTVDSFESSNFDIKSSIHNIPKKEVIQNLGFSEKQAQRFETLADNKDLVEQVKAEARANDDIPTRTRVLDLAQARRKQELDYYQKLDKGHEVYKELNKIITLIIGFEITDERITALLESYDHNVTIQDQLEEITMAKNKLDEIYINLAKHKSRRGCGNEAR